MTFEPWAGTFPEMSSAKGAEYSKAILIVSDRNPTQNGRRADLLVMRVDSGTTRCRGSSAPRAGTSLAVQWLRIPLPMQGTWV